MKTAPKTKLLIVHDKLVCGGAERALLDLIRLLDHNKFDITLYCLRPGGEWQDRFAQTGVRILRPKSKTHKTVFSRFFASIAAHIKYSIFHIDDSINLAHDIHERFDLAVSFKNYLLTDQCRMLAPKCIGYIHGDVLTNKTFEGLPDHLEQLRKWDRIICVSAVGEKSLRLTMGAQADICLAYNPIYAEEVISLSQKPLPIKIGAPYICAVGRLSPEKGMVRLLYVFQRLCDAGIHVKLVIVGDGQDMQLMRYILQGLRCKDDVILAGYDDNPYPYMVNSLLTVIPSYTEGLPVVAPESLCLGVPVVSAYPSVAEAFGGTECGLITENDDDSLYKGLYRMLSDKAVYQGAKAAAEQRSAFYRSDALVRRVEEIYQQVLQA